MPRHGTMAQRRARDERAKRERERDKLTERAAGIQEKEGEAAIYTSQKSPTKSRARPLNEQLRRGRREDEGRKNQTNRVSRVARVKSIS